MATFVMPTVSFVEDYEPTGKLGRTAEPNPFDDVVAALALSWSDELRRSKGAAKLIIPEDMTRTQVTQKFGAATKAAGYSYRADDKANESFPVLTDEGEPTVDAEGNAVTVSLGVIAVYLIPQITRTRKNSRLTVTTIAERAAEEQTETKESAEASNPEVIGDGEVK